jgi:hypothetical protein
MLLIDIKKDIFLGTKLFHSTLIHFNEIHVKQVVEALKELLLD